MIHLFPPLLPKDDLRGPVLVLAAHPDDEVIGCGGMLAWHSRQGHRVTVVHMTDGARGDPGGRFDDIAALRRAEGIEALGRLGVDDLRHWDLPDGELPAHREDVETRLRALLAEVRPATLYSFFFNEAHCDHRFVADVTADVSDALPRKCRCLLFGVNQMPSAGTLFDTTGLWEHKHKALEAYRSQLAYIDFAAMCHHRDHAATVNIGDPAVEHVELFADLTPERLPVARDLANRAYRFLMGDPG